MQKCVRFRVCVLTWSVFAFSKKSVTYVFSMPLNIPTPPAATSFLETTQGGDGHGSFLM